MEECFVCLEEYKSKRNPKIICQHCPAHACRQCHQRHLLLTYEDPHCYACKRGWNSDFMAKNFSISFRTGALRAHRRKVLLEREKALLPPLQIYAEYRRSIQRLQVEHHDLAVKLGVYSSEGGLTNIYKGLKNKHFVAEYHIRKQRKEILRLKEVLRLKDAKDVNDLPAIPSLLSIARKTRDQFKEEVERLEAEIALIEPGYLELLDAYTKAGADLREVRHLYTDKATTQRREFIMRCPAEGCRGFLSTSYKCGTCEAWACVDCHVSVGKDKECGHMCDPNTVLSAKTIKDETRPCPKCGTRIFKIDGCNQMYCVIDGCGTAFSWNTGHIVTGVIHNPHYYEWLRRREGELPREAGDIPCGGMPNTWQMVEAIRNLEMPTEITTLVLESFRNLQELIDHRMRDFPSRLPQLANKEDDVDYLLNEISEEVWQTRLERTENKFIKKREIAHILQTIATAGADMMNRIYERARETTPDNEAMEGFVAWLLSTAIPELEQLRMFGNESMVTLAKRERMAVPQFEANWSWKGLRAMYAKKATQTEIVGPVES